MNPNHDNNSTTTTITTTHNNIQQQQKQQQQQQQPMKKQPQHPTTPIMNDTSDVLSVKSTSQADIVAPQEAKAEVLSVMLRASAATGVEIRNASKARHDDADKEEATTTTNTKQQAIFPEKFLTLTPPTTCQQDRSEAFPDYEIRYVTNEHNKTHMAALVPFVVGALEGAINRSATTSEEQEEKEDDTPAVSRRSVAPFEITGTAITNAATLASAVEYVMMHTVDSAATYVGALILMDRLYLAKAAEGKKLILTYENAYGIFVACARVASKVVEIRCLSNRDWATAARISVVRLNMVESALLRRLQFNVLIRKTEWECYAAQILGTATAATATPTAEEAKTDPDAVDDVSCYIPVDDDVAVSPASSLGETGGVPPSSSASSARGAAVVPAPAPKTITTTRQNPRFAANDLL